MTAAELAAVVADAVHDHVVQSLAPLRERLAAAEAALAALHNDALVKELGALRERVAVVETRPVLPGPPGEPGPPGKDGVDGKAGLTYQGYFQEGKAYAPGDVVTWGGSAWHCFKPTTLKPDAVAPYVATADGGVKSEGGNGKDFWTLLVKRGDRGRDASTR